MRGLEMWYAFELIFFEGDPMRDKYLAVVLVCFLTLVLGGYGQAQSPQEVILQHGRGIRTDFGQQCTLYRRPALGAQHRSAGREDLCAVGTQAVSTRF